MSDFPPAVTILHHCQHVVGLIKRAMPDGERDRNPLVLVLTGSCALREWSLDEITPSYPENKHLGRQDSFRSSIDLLQQRARQTFLIIGAEGHKRRLESPGRLCPCAHS